MSTVVPVYSGSRILYTGDSLTGAYNWYAVSGGFNDQLNGLMVPYAASFPAVAQPGSIAAVGSGTVATSGTVQVPRGPVTPINTGVAGYTTTDVLANINSMILSQTFDVMFLLVGVNDSTSGVPVGTVQSNMTSIITQTKAAKPSARIAIGSVCWPATEQWSSGPPLAFYNVGNPTPPDAINAVYQTLCTTYGCTYVDFTTPLLLAEQSTNTPEHGAVSGVDTIDGKHPNDTGRLIMGNAAIAYFQAAP